MSAVMANASDYAAGLVNDDFRAEVARGEL